MMNAKLKNIAIIDSHLHLWDTGLMRYAWLEDEPAINRNFGLEQYREQTEDFQIQKMVFVQCDCLPEQTLDEIEFVIEQASTDQRLQGIVAYAPLEQGKSVKNFLGLLRERPLVKGVRKMYDSNPSICTSSSFLDAVNLLPEYGLSFDLSIKPSAVADTIAMIKECPQTQFILAHLAKPNIRNNELEAYKKNMEAFAGLPNVVAKISGLITEADRERWTIHQIQPYIDHAIDCFGCDRLMFGGDWPVVLLAGTYHNWLEALFTCVQHLGDEDLNKLFYETAQRTYRL